MLEKPQTRENTKDPGSDPIRMTTAFIPSAMHLQNQARGSVDAALGPRGLPWALTLSHVSFQMVPFTVAFINSYLRHLFWLTFNGLLL